MVENCTIYRIALLIICLVFIYIIANVKEDFTNKHIYKDRNYFIYDNESLRELKKPNINYEFNKVKL